MPCDAQPVAYWPGKKDKIVTPNGEVISCSLTGDPGKETGIGYVTHFATCPEANKFRKK
jgi:hypothetical protein